METLREVLLVHVLHVAIFMGAIVWDRRRLRRVDPYGAARMWRPATLWLVGCGLFLPPIIGWYAHLTITRRGGFWRRHGIALLWTLGLTAVFEVSALLASGLLDVL
jgi:FtsH-binding integral membrane protein